MLIRTDTALNVNRFGQSACELDTTRLRTESITAHNISNRCTTSPIHRELPFKSPLSSSSAARFVRLRLGYFIGG